MKFVFTETNNQKKGLENMYHHILFVLFFRQAFMGDHGCVCPKYLSALIFS